MVRKINIEKISKIIKELCIKSNTELPDDVLSILKKTHSKENSKLSKEILDQIIQNALIAKESSVPICQDTGFTVIFLEIGQNIHLTGGSLKDAVSDGVRQGYIEGYLRKSIVQKPIFSPENTKDNTPPILHIDIVQGDKVKITVFPKGGGSENMSRLKMLKPTDGIEEIKNFVIDTVREAGANSCPPIIVGVGVGGTFDYVAYLAKKALLRKIGQRNTDEKIAKLEIALLEKINKLGIGPAGLGGKITALELFIEEFPRHIASFPVAVNIQCHAARCKTIVL